MDKLNKPLDQVWEPPTDIIENGCIMDRSAVSQLSQFIDIRHWCHWFKCIPGFPADTDIVLNGAIDWNRYGIDHNNDMPYVLPQPQAMAIKYLSVVPVWFSEQGRTSLLEYMSDCSLSIQVGGRIVFNFPPLLLCHPNPQSLIDICKALVSELNEEAKANIDNIISHSHPEFAKLDPMIVIPQGMCYQFRVKTRSTILPSNGFFYVAAWGLMQFGVQ